MSDWINPNSNFDDIFNRLFSQMRQPSVQRVDLGRLLNNQAEVLLGAASEAAAEHDNPEVTPEHLLYAAASGEPTRSMLDNIGVDPDAAAAQMADVIEQYPSGTTSRCHGWGRVCAPRFRARNRRQLARARATSAPSTY